MQLRHSPTSPYVRRVMMLAHERGLADRLTLLPTNAWDPETDLGETNPLGKVPALVVADGAALYDSAVICEYLDSLGTAGPALFPEGAGRWLALRDLALATGITDAAVQCQVERIFRPEERRHAAWVERQKTAIRRALAFAEKDWPLDPAAPFPDIGHLALAAAVGYLLFRFPEDNWLAGSPRLADWYRAAAERESMRRTAPPEA